MNDRFGPVRGTRIHPFMVAVLTGLLMLGITSNALAQGRGPLVILGLRAPDGDDEAASNATTALRRAARSSGFEVPNDSPALEQSMAAFGCDDSLPATCLLQIANDLHAVRLVYGQVRRHGRGRDATLSIEVSIFETASQNTTGHDQVEVPRAMAQDNDSLTASASRLIGTLAPGGAAANHTTSPDANVATSSAPPPVTPPSGPSHARRYVSYGLMGVGGVLLITGAVYGVMWVSLNGTASNDPMWIAYHNGEDYGPVCASARLDAVMTPPVPNSVRVRDLCNTSDSQSSIAWSLGSIGAAVLATGAILLITDHSDAPADEHAAAARRNRPHFAVAPNFSPSYQGATVFMSF